MRFAVKASTPGEALEAVVSNTETAADERTVKLPPTDEDWREAELPPLEPGTYRLTVTGDPTSVEPIADVFGVAKPS